MRPEIPAHFEQSYQRLLNCLKLGGLQPKTIELYSHGVRRAGAYFDYQIDALTKHQIDRLFCAYHRHTILACIQTRFVWVEVLLCQGVG